MVINKTEKVFAKFWTPGILVAEDWLVEISSKDPSKVEWPKDAYCFDMFVEETVEVDGTPFTNTKKIGKRYYHPDSKLVTLEELKNRPLSNEEKRGSCSREMLISNMEGNKWEYLVYSRWGNWPQPFDPKRDEVLS